MNNATIAWWALLGLVGLLAAVFVWGTRVGARRQSARVVDPAPLPFGTQVAHDVLIVANQHDGREYAQHFSSDTLVIMSFGAEAVVAGRRVRDVYVTRAALGGLGPELLDAVHQAQDRYSPRGKVYQLDEQGGRVPLGV